MKIVGIKTLHEFKEKHTDVQSQIDAWLAEVGQAIWRKPSDIKQRYASASFLEDNQVIFNIKGNRYRLLVKVNYKNQIILIKKVGTHDEYLKW